MAVDTAIGTEANQVKGAPIRQKGVGQVIEGRIGGDAAVANGLADAHQFLADNAA